MRDLRLVGYEDGTVVFESLEGEKYRVLADEALRQALRHASSSKPSELTITPREIQDRVRSGETIEELAASTGSDLEFVEKFAQPVLDELAHIVQSALAIRITIAGDRFNDDIQEEFGSLIASRLEANGATILTWSSKRADGGIWHLTATYSIKGHPGLAVWAFEPRKFHLSPENESAIALSNHASTLDAPLAKLRPVAKTEIAPVAVQAAMVDSLQSEAFAKDSNVSAPAAFRRPDEEVAQVITPNDDSSTSDLLDELRKRRETFTDEAPESLEIPVPQFDEDFDDSELEPATGPLQVVPDLETEEESATEHQMDAPDQGESDSQDFVEDAPAAPKKGRAAMPSWDQIVFGTKTDEEL